jgi:hypothetical protein
MEQCASPRAPPSTTAEPAPHGPAPRLQIDPQRFTACFDREPFAFTHNLATLGLFTSAALGELAARYAGHARDYFVSTGARSAGTAFTAVKHGQYGIEEAMRRIDCAPVRVLFKRPENYSPVLRRLFEELFEQVIRLRGGLRGEQVVRREAGLFVTSPHCITPVHYDPEIAFFTQVEGEKTYHIYPPASLTEAELERFYRRGIVSIAEVDLQRRDPHQEHVFHLGPGDGLHQPQNSAHWVETGAQRSISYSFVFETDLTRARGRTRACNYCLRRAGLSPAAPGRYPGRDAAKEHAAHAFFQLRRRYWNVMGRIKGW